ncbi:hypothetical protein CBL_03316 [Carabus blaptoides fortunei]
MYAVGNGFGIDQEPVSVRTYHNFYLYDDLHSSSHDLDEIHTSMCVLVTTTTTCSVLSLTIDSVACLLTFPIINSRRLSTSPHTAPVLERACSYWEVQPPVYGAATIYVYISPDMMIEYSYPMHTSECVGIDPPRGSTDPDNELGGVCLLVQLDISID